MPFSLITKSQVLADFVADWTEAMESTPLPDSQFWIMHFDVSKMKEGSGAGVVLKLPKGDKLSYVLRIHFNATNNVAEYEALPHGHHMAKELGVKRISVTATRILSLNNSTEPGTPKVPQWRSTGEQLMNLVDVLPAWRSDISLGMTMMSPMLW